MKNINYFQQGDVLLFPAEIPQNAKLLDGNILQHGEATGHAHRVMFLHEEKRGGSAGIFQDPKDLLRYLKLDVPTDLVHEEHKKITLPPGEYRIGIVREYDHFQEEARNVQD